MVDLESEMCGESKFTAEKAGLGFHMPTVAPKLPVAPIAPKMDQAFQAVGV
jgi:hypothetical protein